MSIKSQQLTHDWFYDKLNRQGKPERQIKSNGIEQMSYSYDYLWTYRELLALKDNITGHLLLNNQSYSNTSREHKWQVIDSCPYISHPIHFEHGVSHISQEQEVKSAISAIKAILEKQLKARSKYYLNDIEPIVKNIENMQYYLTLKDRLHFINNKPLRKNNKYLNKMYELAKIGNDLESIKDYSKVVEKQVKRNKALKLKQFKDYLIEATERHNQWYKESETKPTPLTNDFIGVYLKIVGDKLKASNHTEIPLREAKIAYKRWLKGKDVLGIKLGDYTVISVSKEQVKIGCTVISANEIHKVLGD